MNINKAIENIRREQEEALGLFKENFGHLFDRVGEAIIATDLDECITEWSQGAENIYGWTMSEVHGQPLSTLLDTRYEDPHETHESVLETLKRGGHWRGTLIQRRKNGQIINVASAMIILRNDNARQVGHVILNRDVTGNKRTGTVLYRLENLNRAISRGLSFGEIFASFIAQVDGLIDFDKVNFSLLNSAGTSTVLRGKYRRNKPMEVARSKYILAGSLSEIVVATGNPVIIPDILKYDSCFATRDVLIAKGIRSVMFLPLMIGGKVIGLLNFASGNPGAFTQHEIDLLYNTVEQMAIALHTTRLLGELTERETQLRELSRQLVEAQENERARLARELHDEIGHSLTILKQNLQRELSKVPANGRDNGIGRSASSNLSQALAITSQLLEQIRDMSSDLRPSHLDDLGLAPALRWYLNRAGRVAGIRSYFDAPSDLERLPSDMETAFFRIAQEAVSNTLRHSKALHVWLQLAVRNGVIELHVTDDGIGFELPARKSTGAARKSCGLINMIERAALIGGELEIDTAPGLGTRVSFRVKLGNPDDRY